MNGQIQQLANQVMGIVLLLGSLSDWLKFPSNFGVCVCVHIFAEIKVGEETWQLVWNIIDTIKGVELSTFLILLSFL